MVTAGASVATEVEAAAADDAVLSFTTKAGAAKALATARIKT